MVDLSTLEGWLTAREDERLEFKAARDSYSPDKLTRYMVALANEGGGHLVLGVTDTLPRAVCGTQAYRDYQRKQNELTWLLRLRVEVTELAHPDGRVLIWFVPGHHRGVPLRHEGVYWTRSGESLVPMTEDRLRALLEEPELDFSATICPGATLASLEPAHIDRFRQLWAERDRRRNSNVARGEAAAQRILTMADAEMLEAASLTEDGSVTYAALVLVGREQALVRHLAQAELIYEFRREEGGVKAQARENYRQGFLGYFDDLWAEINSRNDRLELPAGMLRRPVFAFNEEVVREGLLNAVAHRDYRSQESVFVRQWPHRLDIASPGGFLPGVTPQNILQQHKWRNRRIAEALERCGLVERSGQGADIMFTESVPEAKPLPSFEDSDDQRVVLRLRGVVENPEFLMVMDAISNERLELFDVRDFLVLDEVMRRGRVRRDLQDRIERLVRAGALERTGRGRLMLAQRFYTASGKPGAYTRTKGLARPQQKELVVQHLRESGAAGAGFGDFSEMLPGLTRGQLQTLLKELRKERRIHLVGERRFARWHTGPGSEGTDEDTVVNRSEA